MPTEARRLWLAARGRTIPPLEPATLALLPLPHSMRHPDHTTFLAAARTDACPVRDASTTEVRVDPSIPPEELHRTIAECSRVLAGEGRIHVVVRLRLGFPGLLRSLLAWILHLPPPPTPESVARSLLDHGFDRIEQQIHGSLGEFRARRLPGRNPPT